VDSIATEDGPQPAWDIDPDPVPELKSVTTDLANPPASGVSLRYSVATATLLGAIERI
jgi:hypothetical protein